MLIDYIKHWQINLLTIGCYKENIPGIKTELKEQFVKFSGIHRESTVAYRSH